MGAAKLNVTDLYGFWIKPFGSALGAGHFSAAAVGDTQPTATATRAVQDSHGNPPSWGQGAGPLQI